MCRPLVLLLAVAATAAVLGACSAEDSLPTPSTTAMTATTGGTPPSVTGGGGTPPCLAGDVAFVRDGVVTTLGDDTGDATQVASVRWAAHDGCERLVVDVLTDTGAPASGIGRTVVESTATSGVVRAALPAAVTGTAIADTLFEGALAERVFVVRGAAGNLTVEVHTNPRSAVEVRALVVPEPARLVIDLRPAPAAAPPPVASPSFSDRVVLTTPAPGPAGYPLTVAGYARTSEATVVARLLSGDTVVAERVATAADWLETWGTFSLSFADGPSGPLVLFVGEDAPADGQPTGVFVSLDFP